MTTDAYYEVFLSFLESKGCKDAYLANRVRHTHWPTQYVFSAFVWHTAPEGQPFWTDLHRQWQALLVEAGYCE